MNLNKKKMALILLSAIFFISLDRLLKIIALKYFFGSEFSFLGDIFKFSLAKNYGIAFSIPLGGTMLNILIIIIILAFLYLSLNLYNKSHYLKASLMVYIIFGAFSNLYDRIFHGYVIDYLDLKYFTVFNVADIMIVGAAIGLVLIIKKGNRFLTAF